MGRAIIGAVLILIGVEVFSYLLLNSDTRYSLGPQLIQQTAVYLGIFGLVILVGIALYVSAPRNSFTAKVGGAVVLLCINSLASSTGAPDIIYFPALLGGLGLLVWAAIDGITRFRSPRPTSASTDPGSPATPGRAS